MFQTIHDRLDRISLLAVWAGGATLMLCAIMITVDVFFRKFFSMTMSGSDEITGYVFAASTTWAYSYCLLRRANVRIDAIYNLLPVVARGVLDLIGLLLLLWFMVVLTDEAITVFTTSWEHDSVAITTLATRLWIPQLFWVSGLVLFNFTLVFVIVYSATLMARRDWTGVSRVAGTLSVEEEIQEETAGMDTKRADSGSEG
jgi:TRAP-type C4-dicarboxylate transport system permease small subunit